MLICCECGGINIENKAWVDANTNRVLDICSDDEEDNWCRDCEKHVKFEIKDVRKTSTNS